MSKYTKLYNVHHVKQNAGRFVLDQDGVPQKGDFIRTQSLEEREAKFLNDNAVGEEGLGFGKVYVEVKEEKESSLDGLSKDELLEKIDVLVKDGKIEKPHHSTGIEKLIKIIKETE